MYLIIKRLFDIIFSGIAILILSPIFIIIIFILFFTGEGKVFYFQKRVGYKNKEFYMWKFVTMVSNSTKIGSGIYTAKNDNRILPVGKFLRKSKINELLQLINIFIGDMSFVGPRPLIKETYNLYSQSIKNEISQIKPGLTGIGSIIFRDEESLLQKSKIPINEFYKIKISPIKGMLEVWYKRNYNFILDFKIILVTGIVIFFPGLNNNIFFKNLPKFNL
tara:strand:- start:191 stop:850 length:660 start_codon:yes stop_codon:yes gene_type:complete